MKFYNTKPVTSADNSTDTKQADIYTSPEWQIRVETAPSDDIAFVPQDEARAVTPEDVGYASVDQLISNVRQMFDHEQQDRFSFDMG